MVKAALVLPAVFIAPTTTNFFVVFLANRLWAFFFFYWSIFLFNWEKGRRGNHCSQFARDVIWKHTEFPSPMEPQENYQDIPV